MNQDTSMCENQNNINDYDSGHKIGYAAGLKVGAEQMKELIRHTATMTDIISQDPEDLVCAYRYTITDEELDNCLFDPNWRAR